jgi:tRNA 2-thiouridine synthesizing protein A
MDEFLDTKGLACPLPVLKTRRLLRKMDSGKVLTVEATDPASVIDFTHFCNTTENKMVEHNEADGVFTYVIRRGV